jgi:hypothetical protein
MLGYLEEGKFHDISADVADRVLGINKYVVCTGVLINP